MANETFCKGGNCPLRHNCWRYISGLGVPPMFGEWEEPEYKDGACPSYAGN